MYCSHLLPKLPYSCQPVLNTLTHSYVEVQGSYNQATTVLITQIQAGQLY